MRVDQPEWLYTPDQTGRHGSRVPLSRLFKYGADHHPTRTAIVDGQTSCTFLELERGAQRIAATMHSLGVRQGDRVAILAEKLALMPILAGAIWKLGAVYAPLDADSPPARLRHLIEQLAPAVVLGKAERLAVCQLTLPSITFESLANTASTATAMTRDAECDVDEDDVAYIIFTSGSTGTPKGVMVSHRSLLDYFFNHNQVLRFTPDSRVFSFSPFHFDVSIEDTLLPLSVAAFVYQFRGAPVGALIQRLLTRERITHLIAVSTILSIITPAVRTELPDLEMVMTGAEVCDPKVINQWKHRMPDLRVINAYGPTEATIVCLTHEIDVPDDARHKAYPIGQPLQGVSIKLMGPYGEVTRSGELGELWVGGTQVMKGYLSDPDATNKAVVTCNDVRFYRTGDMCCLNEHGQVEFIGRSDEEVKIAGRRINLGEVRQIALTWPSTSGAAVGLVDIHGRREIAAVIIGEHGPEEIDRIIEYLAGQLPTYMLPRVVASAKSGHVGKTGKTDEKRLIALLNDACHQHGADRYVMAPSGGFISY